MRNAVLVSIHPEHLANVLSGKKVFEYRKVIPSQKISHLVLYCTAPVNKVVAVAEVVDLLKGSPSRIWNETAYGAGITRRFYREYFSGQKSACSFALGSVFELSEPLCLSQFSSCKVPPQSFCYLDKNDSVRVFKSVSSIPSTPASLVFVGGIHGVGKTSICQKAFSSLGYLCVTASSLIYEYGLSTDNNKRVNDITGNQSALIEQLSLKKKGHCRLLLDGHFSLMNHLSQVEPIELWVFREINPSHLILIKGDPKEIAIRLDDRDGENWSWKDLGLFQEVEESHANYVSEQLGIPLQVFDNSTSYAIIANSFRRYNDR